MCKEITFKNISIRKDFTIIKKKFYLNFKKIISKEFYLWRYLLSTKTYCYIIEKQKEIIGHVGFVRYKTQYNNYFLSRHSSFVDKKYRRKNLYSNLIKFCLLKFKLDKISFILIWPNKINKFTNKKFNNLINLSKLKMYISRKKSNQTLKLNELENITQIEHFIKLRNNYSLIKKDKSY